MTRSKTVDMMLCALFAALTAVLSQFTIPIGPIPINLATFAVFCAGAILGAKLGALSMGVWMLLGVAGVPVFTMFRSGIAALTDPIGGFIPGYVIAAFLVGWIVERVKTNRIWVYPVAMVVGMTAYFTTGTAWYMFSMQTSLGKALMTCVVPFLLGDSLKIAAATVVAHRMRALRLIRAEA